MSYLDTYNQRMLLSGSDQAERRRKNAQSTIKRKFSSTEYYEVDGVEPDGTQVVKKMKIIHEDLVMQVNPSRAQSLKFVSYPGEEIKPGTFFENILGDEYMVLSASNMNDIVYRGIMQKVNNLFKWVYGGTLYENFAIISSISMIRDGISEDRVMTLPEDALSISVPQNEVTDTIGRDMRFIVGKYTYKVTKVDRYTNPFLAYIIAYEDVRREGDNFELGIADYNLIETEVPVEVEDFYFHISGPASLRLGETGSYAPEFFNVNDEIEEVVWEVDSAFVEKTSETPTKLVLKASLDFSSIGAEVTITAIHPSLTQTKVIKITSAI